MVLPCTMWVKVIIIVTTATLGGLIGGVIGKQIGILVGLFGGPAFVFWFLSSYALIAC